MIFIYIIVENANRVRQDFLILEILKKFNKKSKYSYWRKK